ncbi:MAG: DUF362 domain-containing protein [Candidatus Delongbacteria bacterium]|nr:DUF362 domain-containing protein [Candidatus Delongbacteria bacterium]
MSKVFINSTNLNQSKQELESQIIEILKTSTDNLNFIRKGDSVLIKPALNSPDPYPSTTHPLAVKVVAQELLKKGAKVIIGDQSGIEHVVHTAEGLKKGSSIENFKKTGIYDACKDLDVKWVAFEQDGWNKGFIHESQPKATSWPNGFWITKWVKDVDHIINLPRISTSLFQFGNDTEMW